MGSGKGCGEIPGVFPYSSNVTPEKQKQDCPTERSFCVVYSYLCHSTRYIGAKRLQGFTADVAGRKQRFCLGGFLCFVRSFSNRDAEDCSLLIVIGLWFGLTSFGLTFPSGVKTLPSPEELSGNILRMSRISLPKMWVFKVLAWQAAVASAPCFHLVTQNLEM